MHKSRQVTIISLLILSLSFALTGCGENDNPVNNGGGGNRPPLGPTDLSATAISQSEIRLEWTDWAENEDGFEIWESVDNDSTFVVVDHTNPDITTSILSGRVAEAAYYYRVRAYNTFGFSTFSNISTVTNQWLRVTFERQDSPPRAIAYHPQGSQLVSGSGDFQVKVWDTETGTLLRSLSRHTAPIKTVAFSPDSMYFASGSEDGSVVIWNAIFLTPYQRLGDFGGTVENVEFFPDGSKLATLSGSVKVWNVLDGSDELEISTYDNFIDFTISNDGSFIVTGSNGQLKFWDAIEGTEIDSVGGIPGLPNDIVVGPNDDLVMVATNNGALVYCERDTSWDIDEIIDAHPQPILCMALSEDGNYLATGCWDWNIKVWNARSRALVRNLEGHTYSIYSLDFRSDGKYLASASGDRTIRIWGPFN